MTVEKLLEEPVFRNLKVLNKKADLKREIFTVESTETPDVASYLPENTLLITTGMAFKDNPSGLCEFIHSLDRLPCAGLAIKLGRFIDHLEPEIIELADQLGFPLLQIPSNMTLGEVFQQLLAYIWDNQNAELTFALNTQKKFSGLLLQGASMSVMMNNLGLVIKKPAALLNPFGEVEAAAHTCQKEHLRAAQALFHNLSLYERKTDSLESLINSPTINQKVRIYPIQTVGRNPYYLYIYGGEEKEYDLSNLVIEQLVLVFGILLYKNLYVRCNPLKQKEAILHIIVNKYKKERWSAAQLFTVGEKYGLKPASSYKIILATLEPFGGREFDFLNLSHREERYILIYDWLNRKFQDKFHGDIIVFPETLTYQYVLLIQGNFRELESLLESYHEALLRLLQVQITFSFGNSVAQLETIDNSYNTALESYQYGEEKEGIPYIKYFKSTNANELFKMVSGEQIKGFCLYHLKGLTNPEDEMTLELRRTLKTYLDCRCSVTETANHMFLHRNTIKYRIKKCEEILGREIADANYCFQLQLSLVLLEQSG
ncbi:PucR family transcriptional regulator [Lacrimispora sp.]|uniref:PucR family transcriptional regulator n=1 Tax=Lacrimispora sp. TaxID=2719234 RepID=UPI0034613481